MVLARVRGRSYAVWAICCLAAVLGFLGWHLWLCRTHGRPLSGSSPAAFAAGIAAATIVMFETAFALRKRWRRVAPWMLLHVRWWLHAHLWLGALTLPLVLIHTGGFLGGSYSMLLLAVFLIVWGSGVAGWALQQRLPRTLIEEAPHETVANAAPVVVDNLLKRAKLVLPVRDLQAAEAWRPKPFACAAPTVLPHRRQDEATPAQRSLLEFHDRVLAPYLTVGGRRGPLADPLQADAMLNGLATDAGDRTADAVVLWRRLCNERRDLDRQLRWQALLNGWLALHVPATAVLLALLAGHVVVAWRHAVWLGW